LLAKPVRTPGTIAGPPHLGEGEAAVWKPLGDRYVVIARIANGDWAALVNPELKVETRR
jgi:hypothetical protein